MVKIDLEEIEKKHKKIISIAKKYLLQIKDYEHNIKHTEDVIEFGLLLIEKLSKNLIIDIECLYVSIWWHDVGRLFVNIGHEKLSAKMAKEELIKNQYSIEFSDKCYNAIIYHKWNMIPETMEGLVLRDADKLGWIGIRRWKECLNNNQRLNDIINLLPNLRNKILYFYESRIIYDYSIVGLIDLLSKYSK